MSKARLMSIVYVIFAIAYVVAEFVITQPHLGFCWFSVAWLSYLQDVERPIPYT